MDIRLATQQDMGAFAQIVNHYIAHTAINFRSHEQTDQDWRTEFDRLGDRYPWLVAERGESIDGIAYATPWNERTAYGWSVEVTGYVRAGCGGQGIGNALYDRLLGLLDTQGYETAIAVIALPNGASVALHESFGFKHVGTLDRIGFKNNEWHDVGLWQRRLGRVGDPAPIGSVAEAARLLGT